MGLPCGSFITCPECYGERYVEIGDVSYGDYTQAQARACRVCADGDSVYAESRGWLELPLAPEVADRVYEHCSTADSEALVCQWWDRGEDAAVRCDQCESASNECRDCYQLRAEQEMRSW